MSGSITRPDYGAAIAALTRRLDTLERRLTPTAVFPDEIIFSYAGAIAASTSPPVRARRGGVLSTLAVVFGTAGSGDTVIDVVRNGTTVATITIPSGAATYSGSVGVRFTKDVDLLNLAITTAGAGAADMTAAARFT